MTLAQKIDDILHGRTACDDKLQAIGAAVAAELARANSDASEVKAPFKTPVKFRQGTIMTGVWRLEDVHENVITVFDTAGQAEYAVAAINAYNPERDKAVQGLVDALWVARKLIAHSDHASAEGRLKAIDAAIANYEASKK